MVWLDAREQPIQAFYSRFPCSFIVWNWGQQLLPVSRQNIRTGVMPVKREAFLVYSRVATALTGWIWQPHRLAACLELCSTIWHLAIFICKGLF